MLMEFSEEEYATVCCSPVHSIVLQHNADGTPIVVQEQPQVAPIVMTDVLGLTWCQDCQYRGEFINWGKAHNWPALEIRPYAMAEGAYYWHFTACQGGESRVWTFLGLIEMLDEAEKQPTRQSA